MASTSDGNSDEARRRRARMLNANIAPPGAATSRMRQPPARQAAQPPTPAPVTNEDERLSALDYLRASSKLGGRYVASVGRAAGSAATTALKGLAQSRLAFLLAMCTPAGPYILLGAVAYLGYRGMARGARAVGRFHEKTKLEIYADRQRKDVGRELRSKSVEGKQWWNFKTGQEIFRGVGTGKGVSQQAQPLRTATQAARELLQSNPTGRDLVMASARTAEAQTRFFNHSIDIGKADGAAQKAAEVFKGLDRTVKGKWNAVAGSDLGQFFNAVHPPGSPQARAQQRAALAFNNLVKENENGFGGRLPSGKSIAEAGVMRDSVAQAKDEPTSDWTPVKAVKSGLKAEDASRVNEAAKSSRETSSETISDRPFFGGGRSASKSATQATGKSAGQQPLGRSLKGPSLAR